MNVQQISTSRRDVKIEAHTTWVVSPHGTKMVETPAINSSALIFKVVDASLILQHETVGGLVDIECPWIDGTIVYVRSTDILPSFIVPTTLEISCLERFTAYQIIRKTAHLFSLRVLNQRTRMVDVDVMGDTACVSFTDSGSGQHVMGFGYPFSEPITEQKTRAKQASVKSPLTDNSAVASITDKITFKFADA